MSMSCYQCFYIKIHWCFYDGEKSYFLLYSFGYDCLFCIWGMTEKNGLCWSHAPYALSRLQRTSIFSVFLLTGIVNLMFLVLFYCVVVNVVFSLMVEKEKRRLWCTNQEIFSTPVELKEQIECTGVVLIVYGWQHSYFNNRCYYLWIYTDDTPAK